MDTDEQPERHARPSRNETFAAAVELASGGSNAFRRFARRYSLCAADADDAYQRSLEILLRKRVTSSDDGEYRDGPKRGVLRGEGQIGSKRYDRSDRRAVAGEAATT